MNTGVTARQGARADTRGEPGRLLICSKSFRLAEAPPSVRAGPGHGALPLQLPEPRSRTGPRDGPGLPASTCAAASGLSAWLRSAWGGLGLPSPSPPTPQELVTGGSRGPADDLTHGPPTVLPAQHGSRPRPRPPGTLCRQPPSAPTPQAITPPAFLSRLSTGTRGQQEAEPRVQEDMGACSRVSRCCWVRGHLAHPQGRQG